MTNDYGLVSIITPCYNSQRFLSETIESVLAQTYTNWELLIQDDCSTDNSYDVAMRYAKRDSRIKVARNERNSRAAVTRNNAIRRSQGVWIAFLDSDDLWMPEKLERQLRFMTEHKAQFTFMQYEHFGEDGCYLGDQAQVVNHLTYRRLMLHCWPGCLTVMYRQDPKNKIYCENIVNNEDHALFLRAVASLGEGRGIPECLSLYRIRQGSLSRNKFKLIKPYFDTIYKLEHKNIPFAWLCVATHVLVKTLFKYKRVSYEDSTFLKYKMLQTSMGGEVSY